MHRGEDDLPLAERAGKRMVEEIEFDGAHCEIVSKWLPLPKCCDLYHRLAGSTETYNFPTRVLYPRLLRANGAARAARLACLLGILSHVYKSFRLHTYARARDFWQSVLLQGNICTFGQTMIQYQNCRRNTNPKDLRLSAAKRWFKSGQTMVQVTNAHESEITVLLLMANKRRKC